MEGAHRHSTALLTDGFSMIPADRPHDGSSADPWHGGTILSPHTATTLVTGVGSSAEPLPTDNPCSPKSPRPPTPPALHLLSHRAASRQAQLQGQSAWSICSGTVSSPPARPQHGCTACCHAAGTAAMEIREWERSWCCRGQGEGKCPVKGTAGGQCDNPSPARCPQKSPTGPDLERSRKKTSK